MEAELDASDSSLGTPTSPSTNPFDIFTTTQCGSADTHIDVEHASSMYRASYVKRRCNSLCTSIIPASIMYLVITSFAVVCD